MALYYAIWACNVEYVDILLNSGVDPNEHHDYTPFMFAAANSNDRDGESIIRMFIDANVDINCRDDNGWTALMHTVNKQKSTEATVKMLIDAGADTTNIFKYAHKDKKKFLYDYIILPHKITFSLGRRDPNSIVSKLPREICKVILEYLEH